MVDFINEILPQIETLASSDEENGSSNGSVPGSKEDSPTPMDLGIKMQQPPRSSEMMMKMPMPGMIQMGPQGGLGDLPLRPPPPEMMHRMMGAGPQIRPPPPEMLARMAAAAGGPRGERIIYFLLKTFIKFSIVHTGECYKY